MSHVKSVSMWLLALVPMALLASSARVAPQSARATTHPRTSLPVTFEANVGQAEDDVRFISRTASGTVVLGRSGARTFVRVDGGGDARLREAAMRPDAGFAPSVAKYAHVDLEFAGARVGTPVSGVDRVVTVSNYYRGDDTSKWFTGVPHFAKARYEGLYAGIDLEFHGSEQGSMEYDFIVAPHADASQIELALNGEAPARLDAEGNLCVQVGPIEMKHSAPVAYQEHLGERVLVAARFEARTDGRFGFALGHWDRSRTLVIDPTVLIYSTYFGGNAFDVINDVAVDANLDAIVVGDTTSAWAPLPQDVFVAKFNNAANLVIWFAIVGGSGAESGHGIALDAAGDVFITGITNYGLFFPFFPVTAGAFQVFFGGIGDAFVTKLTGAAGAMVWSTLLGAGGLDSGDAIAIGPNQNPYVTGFTNSPGFPVTPFAFQVVIGGAPDVFVTQFNPVGGAQVYSTFLGGAGGETGRDIIIDPLGHATLVGINGGGAYPVTPGCYQPIFGGVSDLIVTQLNVAGAALTYSTYLGGALGDYTYRGIGLDAANNIYVGGTTQDPAFPVTPGCFQGVFGGGGWDGFFTILPAVGGPPPLLYSTFVGGAMDDVVHGVTANAAGDGFVAGYTNSVNFPVVAPFPLLPIQIANAGGYDAFAGGFRAILTPAPAISVTYHGGELDDFAFCIAVDGNGDLYVGGMTNSVFFPVTPGVAQGALVAAPDGFLSKMN